PTPRAMRRECPDSLLRDWFVRPRSHFNGALRRTYESADLVIGVAPYVAQVLSGFRIRKFDVLPDMGFYDLPAPRTGSSDSRVLRLIYVGRLIRSKGLEDGIAALAT